MITYGHINLDRNIWNDPIYWEGKFDPFRCWIDLLLLANFKDGYDVVNGMKVDTERGSLVMSRGDLSARWKISYKTVCKNLERFEKEGKIEISGGKRYTKIIICNYNKYQNCAEQNAEQKENEISKLANGEGVKTTVSEKQNAEQNAEPLLTKKDNNIYIISDDDAHTHTCEGKISDHAPNETPTTETAQTVKKPTSEEEMKRFAEIYDSSTYAIEVLAMQHKITVEQIREKLKLFVAFALSKQKAYNSYSEFSGHFYAWLPKHLEAERYNARKSEMTETKTKSDDKARFKLGEINLGSIDYSNAEKGFHFAD